MNDDPRVELVERLFADPDARRAIERHAKRLFPAAPVRISPRPRSWLDFALGIILGALAAVTALAALLAP